MTATPPSPKVRPNLLACHYLLFANPSPRNCHPTLPSARYRKTAASRACCRQPHPLCQTRRAAANLQHRPSGSRAPSRLVPSDPLVAPFARPDHPHAKLQVVNRTQIRVEAAGLVATTPHEGGSGHGALNRGRLIPSDSSREIFAYDIETPIFKTFRSTRFRPRRTSGPP